jgi:hypothetical protein
MRQSREPWLVNMQALKRRAKLAEPLRGKEIGVKPPHSTYAPLHNSLRHF